MTAVHGMNWPPLSRCLPLAGLMFVWKVWWQWTWKFGNLAKSVFKDHFNVRKMMSGLMPNFYLAPLWLLTANGKTTVGQISERPCLGPTNQCCSHVILKAKLAKKKRKKMSGQVVIVQGFSIWVKVWSNWTPKSFISPLDFTTKFCQYRWILKIVQKEYTTLPRFLLHHPL